MSLREEAKTRLSDLCEILPDDVVSMLLRGFRRAKEKRDPSLIYHYLSLYTRRYSGMTLLYKSEPYHKVYLNTPRIPLPEPKLESGVDVFEAIRRRRSRRSFSSTPLTIDEIATLLYYTAGISAKSRWGELLRTYPSAGNLQPVEVYLVASNIVNLERGLYHYNPSEHSLELIKQGDFSIALSVSALDQTFIAKAAANVILTVAYKRTASKYGLRAYRYVLLDSAFASQNLYLAAEALGLSTVAVGAFYDEEICKLLNIDCEEEFPVLIFPVGKRA